MTFHRLLHLILPLLIALTVDANLDFYIDSEETELLYGVKTKEGIYYIRNGVVHQYAMNFQDQVGTHSVQTKQILEILDPSIPNARN